MTWWARLHCSRVSQRCHCWGCTSVLSSTDARSCSGVCLGTAAARCVIVPRRAFGCSQLCFATSAELISLPALAAIGSHYAAWTLLWLREGVGTCLGSRHCVLVCVLDAAETADRARVCGYWRVGEWVLWPALRPLWVPGQRVPAWRCPASRAQLVGWRFSPPILGGASGCAEAGRPPVPLAAVRATLTVVAGD